MGKLQTIYVATILLLAAVSGAGLGSASAAGNADGGVANAFGQLVSEFVDGLQKSGNANTGFRVATFVLSNNPAADVIPDHAGPPADRVSGPPDHVGAGNSQAGPPDDAGPPDETRGGPPGDAGPDDRGPPSDAGPSDSDDRGPPSDASQGNDDTQEDTRTPTETDDGDSPPVSSTDDESSGDESGPPSNRGGPPDDAGPSS